ncbi:Archaetidylinositol phosphate synthase [Saliniradius amylolyticus]|uniref:Archaetidylinositol phosphate synthase n=1 Tax=Saliniradius amylolyticus TaxID=2183582 RepID=A0A2S2E6Z3_9ALTE|nr:CDP-alcohol phosphatidyltransferase family protein [Saliniradius amylolyticus]AWL13010.1 Archaetidylinositol phosphate synthase [Saliniradius amylolyticus]
MIDPLLNRAVGPPLAVIARLLVRLKLSADQITIGGFVLGMAALPAIYFEHYSLALLFILLNRLADGLDGAVARQTHTSDAGGFLDIVLDFIFYSAVVFAFIAHSPADYGLAGAFLMLSFMGTGGSFLAFAVMAGKHRIDNPDYPNKSLHYMSGLAEGFETILTLCLLCLFPQHFVLIAVVFALICWVTAAVRIITGYQTLKALPAKGHQQ